MDRTDDNGFSELDLPPELREEVRFGDRLEHRVMAEVRRRAALKRDRRGWGWFTAPREVRLTLRPWMAIPALAAAALLLAVFAPWRRPAAPGTVAERPDSVFVRFELYAPTAHQVNLAGSFNGWNAETTPLVQVDGSGLWTVTVPLRSGQVQYGFMVDGRRWVPDPAAPSVDDGFGRRNSVMAVSNGRAL